jgi:hypothetical protein
LSRYVGDHTEWKAGRFLIRQAQKACGQQALPAPATPFRHLPAWLKFKNPEAPAVRREAEEDWAR